MDKKEKIDEITNTFIIEHLLIREKNGKTLINQNGKKNEDIHELRIKEIKGKLSNDKKF